MLKKGEVQESEKVCLESPFSLNSHFSLNLKPTFAPQERSISQDNMFKEIATIVLEK